MEKNKIEYRKAYKYELRDNQSNDSNMSSLSGYIAKFNSVTELFEGFYEQIDPSAFNNTLRDGHNIFLLYHHQWDKPLASTAIGTLELSVDDVGLRFDATINTSISYCNDVVQLMKQGLVGGCSFGFICNDEDIQYNSEDDSFTRTLLDVELFEGSLLCIPQYEDTEAELSDEEQNSCNKDNKMFVRAREIAKEERQKLQDSKDEIKKKELRKKQIEIELELLK